MMAMLVDGSLSNEYWKEASRYATFIYNLLPPPGKGEDGKARRSPQEVFYDMGPSLLLYYLRPFGVWCFTHITVQGRKRKHRRSHPVWGNRVRFMGFEKYTLVDMRLFDTSTNDFIINSATFPPGPDYNGMQIPSELIERVGVKLHGLNVSDSAAAMAEYVKYRADTLPTIQSIEYTSQNP